MNFIEAAAGIRDGFYVSAGRLFLRVEQIMEAWKENKEARRSFRSARPRLSRVRMDNSSAALVHNRLCSRIAATISYIATWR